MLCAGHQRSPPLRVLGGQREHHGGGGGVGFDLGVAVGDGGDLAGLFVVEVIEPALHRLDVAAPLLLLLIGPQHGLGFGLLAAQKIKGVAQVRAERGEDVAGPLDVGRLAFVQLLHHQLVPALGPGMHRLLQPGTQRRVRERSRYHTARRGHGGSPGSAGHRRGHGRALFRPSPQPSPGGPRNRTPARNTSSCSRTPPRPTSTMRVTAATNDSGRSSIDHGRHPVQRRIDAPQRAAQQSLRFLHDRVTEVDVHQIAAAFRDSAGRT